MTTAAGSTRRHRRCTPTAAHACHPRSHSQQPASRLAVLRCLSSLSGLHIRGSHYFGHEHAYIKEVTLSKGVRQDLAWIRNDPYVDELCVRASNFPHFATEIVYSFAPSALPPCLRSSALTPAHRPA